MDGKAKIAIVVGHAVIQTKQGESIEANAYRSTTQGIYYITTDIAGKKKCIFYPNDNIAYITFDVDDDDLPEEKKSSKKEVKPPAVDTATPRG